LSFAFHASRDFSIAARADTVGAWATVGWFSTIVLSVLDIFFLVWSALYFAFWPLFTLGLGSRAFGLGLGGISGEASARFALEGRLLWALLWPKGLP
jgi:hypothetical protein